MGSMIRQIGALSGLSCQHYRVFLRSFFLGLPRYCKAPLILKVPGIALNFLLSYQGKCYSKQKLR